MKTTGKVKEITQEITTFSITEPSLSIEVKAYDTVADAAIRTEPSDALAT